MDVLNFGEIVNLLLVLSIAASVAGFMAGLLGVGGGIIMVPALYYAFTVLDFDIATRMHISVGTSLAIIVPTSIISAKTHMEHKTVDVNLVKSFGYLLAKPLQLGLVMLAEAGSSNDRIMRTTRDYLKEHDTNGLDIQILSLVDATNFSLERLKKDPNNILLARSNSYRLPAEIIRDNALKLSGLLNTKFGGPSVKPYQPKGLWKEKNNFSVPLLEYEESEGEDLYRRGIYTFIKRTSPPPNMLTFDATSREVCTVKRNITSTPLQALVLMNDPQFFEASRIFAEKIIKNRVTLKDQITFGFRLSR